MGNRNTSMKLPSSAKSDNSRATQFQQTPPTYEESTQNVMEKYKKQVQHAETPEDLLEPLLSGMGIYEKRKLIEDAPDVVFKDMDLTQKTLNLETQLEDANYDELAQRVAYRYHLLNAASNRNWYKELIKLDVTLRWIIQRRTWCEQKAKALQTCQRDMSSPDLSRLEAYEEQIKSLNSRYWVTHRKQWIESDKLRSISAKRALTRQRKHTDWYLSGVLREDCAKRGGCCGRSCGCCERTRMTKVYTDGVRDRGHCTTACSCCLETHGIDGEHLEMKDVDEVHFGPLRDDHTLRLLKGYIFYLNGME
ncbi:hypothetical protein PENFLA_c037G01342 [Penicillium flavigenum]|uniref:Uncharacterized protein n=1 Tax=Penicillium flavigenum TaxID=254877 RepID=A0A1V6SKM6_9EURO|nr:hypothetical protein PENFLA_c037G01342 [Penicillium flavigenum]